MARAAAPLALAAAVALLLVLAVASVSIADGARTRLRGRVFRPNLTPMHDRISTSDPANNPMSVAAFLGGNDDSPLIQSWANAIDEAPRAQRLDQQVLTRSQSQQQARQQSAADSSLLETGWVREGQHASAYEPKNWPANSISPDPYKHLAQTHGGGTNAHNNIEGALGVQSAAIPWDYRHYSGNLNSHRKAEPLVYTPLVLAKDHDGESAIDLTSLVNRKYQAQRMSSNPQYANTLSALTDYKPLQANPTDHWLPQIPISGAPGVKNSKTWEAHFLDLYAPTPPPLLAPVAPQMKKPRRAASLMEVRSITLPSVLTQGTRARPLITPMLDANSQPIAFHDVAGEDEFVRHSRDVDIFAPAATQRDEPAVFIEQEVELDETEMADDLELEAEEEPEADW